MSWKRRCLAGLGGLALLAASGGCELLSHVRIEADDRNPNSFAGSSNSGLPKELDAIGLEASFGAHPPVGQTSRRR